MNGNGEAAGAESRRYPDFKRELSQSQCRRCELARERTHIVVDRGNALSRVMIIGEAPGRNEDLEGKPFVGRAGRLLDKTFRELGFVTDEHSLVCNVVKCRPPKNRPPTTDEVNACRPFLLKQIELVKPQWVILLGATALKHMMATTSKTSLGDYVGRFMPSPIGDDSQWMAVYHPAYILRDPRKLGVWKAHLGVFIESWKKELCLKS